MKNVALTQQVPEKFVQLCRNYYHVSPEYLVESLVFSFCLAPPRHLILIERATDAEELAAPEMGAPDQSPLLHCREERASM